MLLVTLLLVLGSCGDGRSVSTDAAADDDGPSVDGQVVDGQVVDGQVVDGQVVDGQVVDGQAADGKPGCGDPEVMARFSACMSADTKSSCELAGGTWTTIGLAPDPSCLCPTGQDGCTCTSSKDCLGSCRAPHNPSGLFDCAGVTQGTCAAYSPSVGCWCWFDENGNVQGLCAD